MIKNRAALPDMKYANAFSLMEMMVVLLIVAIIAAASAPMITKKALRSASSGGSPILWADTNNATLPSGNLIIGNTTQGTGSSGSPNFRLYVDGTSRLTGNADIGGSGTTTNLFGTTIVGGILRLSDGIIQDVEEKTIIERDNNTINIGSEIPAGTNENDILTINIQGHTKVSGKFHLSDGTIYDSGDNVIIGNTALEQSEGGLSKKITLGDENTLVHIPGGLVVDQGAILGKEKGVTFIRATRDYEDNEAPHDPNEADVQRLCSFEMEGVTLNFGGTMDWIPHKGDAKHGRSYVGGSNASYGTFYSAFSDRRLKNVGEKFTAGLEELKKLNFFHYTFKKDETKRPQVGVIAQDLQEVFPDAVTIGTDGYLRIRWDEMFYAVINAVKQLDEKIAKITEDVKANFDKTAQLEATIAEQQKVIEDLKTQNEIYEKQFEVIEKRLKKLEKKEK